MREEKRQPEEIELGQWSPFDVLKREIFPVGWISRCWKLKLESSTPPN